MKKTIFYCSALMLLASCAAELEIISDDVPSAVSTAFKAKYPSAQSVEWSVEKEDGHMVFGAEFKLNNKRKEADFKPDGTFLKEE
ncbi:MAG TPA: hypothetical protein VLB84_16680 [Bacteroidia bacterium]|nr:hypothetical protein [Bacteroidia bacterium]